MNALQRVAHLLPGECSAGKPGEVLAVDIAREKAKSVATPVAGVENLPLHAAAGRVAGMDIIAPSRLPPFDNSAMDGYAVCSANFADKGPWTLPVAGRIPAGETRYVEAPGGTAIRIFTGAPVPAGFDSVIMQEHCRVSGERIEVFDRPDTGKNIRRAGEDVALGAVIVRSGDRLTPARIAVLAACGIDAVPAFRKINVGLISTGSELREPGEAIVHGQIYNSNRAMLRAMLAAPWIAISDFGIVRDDPQAIRNAVKEACGNCDVLITTGGVSAGEEDHMLDVLKRENAELNVLKVAMRPGKPVTIGRIGEVLYAGLPGNPFAAAMTLRQIAMPAIRRVAGMTETDMSWFAAVSGFSYCKKPGRTEFVPVAFDRRDETGRPVLKMLGRGSSASLSPFAAAAGIAMLPPETGDIAPGIPLRFEPFCE